MWLPSQFMTILWVLLDPACSFYEPFAGLGSQAGTRSGDSSHIGIGKSFGLKPGGTPCNGLYTEAPPERGTFFRLQERYVRKFELQVPTTWNKGLTRFRQSLYFSFRLNKTSAGSRLSNRGGGGHPDSEIKGGPGLKKNFFSALRASFWSKTKGAPDSPAPLP